MDTPINWISETAFVLSYLCLIAASLIALKSDIEPE